MCSYPRRQRLAIARAILKGSKVLILDEATSGACRRTLDQSIHPSIHPYAGVADPTSYTCNHAPHTALDAESEALVQAALENLMKGRTTLVIAHRLGTVVGSDNIAVVKRGVVVEQGTHAQLMSPSAVGHYRQLMATQQTAYLNE